MTGSISGVGGGISASALKQMQDEMFKKADKNEDGSISKDEFSQIAKSGKKQESSNIDDNFSQMDSDSDGAISKLESDAAIAKAGQQMQSGGMPPQGPPPGPPPSEGASSDSSQDSSNAKTVFDAMNTNKDGTVSLAELTAALDKSKESSGTSEKMSRSQDVSADDTVAKTLQAMLDAIDKSSSSNADNSTNNSLKSILASALNSYLEQASNSYELSSVKGTSLSATA